MKGRARSSRAEAPCCLTANGTSLLQTLTFPPSFVLIKRFRNWISLAHISGTRKSLLAGLCARSLANSKLLPQQFPQKDHDDADIQDLVGELSGDRSVHANLGVVAR